MSKPTTPEYEMHRNKLLYGYLTVIALSTNPSFGSEMVHEVDKLANVLSSTQIRSAISLGSPIYSDEMAMLVDKRKAIIEPYAPTNLWRKTFNGFKKSDAVKYQDRIYSIAGLRHANPEDAKAIRQKTIASLPHNAALISNTRGFLYVKAALADNEGYVQIQYGYVPGLLDHSGTPEYTFSVETALSIEDRAQYNQLTKQINELNHYIALDQQDRDEETPQVSQLWDRQRNPENASDHLKLGAQAFVDDCLADYANLRIDRIVLLTNYRTLKTDGERTMLRHFSNKVLEYRKYLVNATSQMQGTMNDEKFEESLRAFQSNCSRFSQPLMKFPKWFITKDTKATEYAFYQNWK